MSRLLYLHGVGDDGSRLDWVDELGVDPKLVIAPDYSDLLRNVAEIPPSSTLPAVPPVSDQARHRYRARQAHLHEELLRLGSAATWQDNERGFGRVPGIIDAIGETLVVGFIYEQVGTYTQHSGLRAAIRERILASFPSDSEDVVVVAHSLGALVALDLIQHRPEKLRVDLLVTAASALARRQIPDQILQLRHDFPYDRVQGWINVYNPSDAVTRGRPIGPRFPQTIDVRASGSIGDHALATCLADPGVAQAMRTAIHTTDSARWAPTPQTPSRTLTRTQALELAVAQLTMHMADILAAQPQTKPEDLDRFAEARRLVAEAIGTDTSDAADWEADNADILARYTAEEDVPAILIRLAATNPMRRFQIEVPDGVERDARFRAAIDIGLPPAWIEVAGRCLAQVERALPQFGNESQASTDSAPADAAPASAALNEIAESIQGTVAALTSEQALPAIRDGLADLRPALAELIARAVLADRLGSPRSGHEERDALSRLMSLLGEQRARLAQVPEVPPYFRSQLRATIATVGDGLTWLADEGIGLRPVRRQASSEHA